VHHPAAEGPRAVDPRPARRQPLQRLLVQVLGEVRVRRQQRRDAQQRVSGLGDEFLKGTRLLSVHSIP
jgi:hypothetical protein